MLDSVQSALRIEVPFENEPRHRGKEEVGHFVAELGDVAAGIADRQLLGRVGEFVQVQAVLRRCDPGRFEHVAVVVDDDVVPGAGHEILVALIRGEAEQARVEVVERRIALDRSSSGSNTPLEASAWKVSIAVAGRAS